MPESIRVMSFNLWHGGDAGGQPLKQTIAVITRARADIVGLQETAGLAPEGAPRPLPFGLSARKPSPPTPAEKTAARGLVNRLIARIRSL